MGEAVNPDSGVVRAAHLNKDRWKDADWALLGTRVRRCQVTPILGAGASIHVVGGSAAVAQEMAMRASVRFAGTESLGRIAQYAAQVDRDFPGESIADVFKKRLEGFRVADILDEFDIYRYLTGLPLPVWVTTNYDDLILRGLRYNNKSPAFSVAKWTPPDVYWDAAKYDRDQHEPTVDCPLVFYLHGRFEDVRSMVVAESDYLEFLEQMSSRPGSLVPQVVRDRLAGSSLLFVGYSFNDMNIQLLLRQWATTKSCYAVQPPPESIEVEGTDLAKFTECYEKRLCALTRKKIKVYWGTASQFCSDYASRFSSDYVRTSCECD